MLPPLIADMNIAVPVAEFLRDNEVDIISVREEGQGTLTDSEIMAKAYEMQRFVLTQESDFGMLAMRREEPFTGIIYLRLGHLPPDQVVADLKNLLEAEINWTSPVIAVYQSGRLRLRSPLII